MFPDPSFAHKQTRLRGDGCRDRPTQPRLGQPLPTAILGEVPGDHRPGHPLSRRWVCDGGGRSLALSGRSPVTCPQPANRPTWLEVQASRAHGLPPPHRGSPGLGQGPAEDGGHDSCHRRPALSWAPPSPPTQACSALPPAWSWRAGAQAGTQAEPLHLGFRFSLPATASLLCPHHPRGCLQFPLSTQRTNASLPSSPRQRLTWPISFKN